MKKLLTAFAFIFVSINLYAQENAQQAKVYRSEFGIDATGFIKQFLNFNSAEFSSYYAPTYYLTYRYHFKNSNIRFAIGGNFQNNEDAGYYIVDSIRPIYHDKENSIDVRIGYEGYSNLSKRWQVFYGVDFRPSFDHIKNDDKYSQGGYVYGTEETKNIYGIAPVLGFRFKISQRLSLTTEINYSVNLEIDKNRNYYTPEAPQYLQLPDQITPKTKSIYSTFSQPLSLFIVFDI